MHFGPSRSELRQKVLLLLVAPASWFYRLVVSPALHLLVGAGAGCRFEPTCSHYASEAVKSHGLMQGGFLTFRRILRCHPFCRGGWDPVPQHDLPSPHYMDSKALKGFGISLWPVVSRTRTKDNFRGC